MAGKPQQTTLTLMSIELILIIAAVFIQMLVVICYALQNRTTHEVALMMGSMLGAFGLFITLGGLLGIVLRRKGASEYFVATGILMLIFSMTLVPPGNWWGRIPIGILYVTPFAIGLGSRFGVKGSEFRLALAMWLALMGCIVTIALFVRDGLQAEDVAAGVIGILVGTAFLKKPAKKPPAKKKPKDAPASGPAQPAPGPGPS